MMSLAISIIPNLLYLLILKALDSFALARFKLVLRNMLIGLAWCALAFGLTNPVCLGIPVTVGDVSLMPLIEEILKGIIPVCLIFRHKFRFMAQSLIYGAAVGSGFSLLENILYFYFNPEMAFGTALVRGLGCAILHMGCTALFATILLLAERTMKKVPALVISILPSVTIHFLHNRVLEYGLVNPMVELVLVVAVFLGLFIFLFIFGEMKIRKWMDRSINDDITTLSAIRSGNFASTKTGEYLLNVKEHFPPEMFFDMLCYVRLFLELKVDKQSEMLMRQAGFTNGEAGDRHAARSAKKAEMKSLAEQIGRTGMLVLAPLTRDNL